jgi:hypothetical protein
MRSSCSSLGSGEEQKKNKSITYLLNQCFFSNWDKFRKTLLDTVSCFHIILTENFFFSDMGFRRSRNCNRYWNGKINRDENPDNCEEKDAKNYNVTQKYHLLNNREGEIGRVLPLAGFIRTKKNRRNRLTLRENIYIIPEIQRKKKSKSSVSQEKLGCFLLLCVF